MALGSHPPPRPPPGSALVTPVSAGNAWVAMIRSPPPPPNPPTTWGKPGKPYWGRWALHSHRLLFPTTGLSDTLHAHTPEILSILVSLMEAASMSFSCY